MKFAVFSEEMKRWWISQKNKIFERRRFSLIIPSGRAHQESRTAGAGATSISQNHKTLLIPNTRHGEMDALYCYFSLLRIQWMPFTHLSPWRWVGSSSETADLSPWRWVGCLLWRRRCGLQRRWRWRRTGRCTWRWWPSRIWLLGFGDLRGFVCFHAHAGFLECFCQFLFWTVLQSSLNCDNGIGHLGSFHCLPCLDRFHCHPCLWVLAHGRLGRHYQRWLLVTDQYLAKLGQKWLCPMLSTRNPTMHRYLN